MAGVKTIRSLSRGLEVMQALEDIGPCTLHQLAHATGLPKPTLLRVLHTLEAAGRVRRGIADQLYHYNFGAVRSPAIGWKAILSEVAAPVLDQLCGEVLWPSDIGIYEDGVIHVQETTRRLSPFLLNRDVLGTDIPVLPSAMGRAMLAWSTPDRQEAVLQRLAGSRRPADLPARNRQWVDRLLAEIAARGYAWRQFGHYVTKQREGAVSAIALPIFIKGLAVGAVNLAWVRSAFSEEEFAAKHLGRLSEAASQINRRLDERLEHMDSVLNEVSG